MAEQKVSLAERFRGKGHLLFAYGLGLLLLIRLGLYLMMQGYAGEPTPPTPPANLPTVDMEAPTIKKVQGMLETWPPYEESDYYLISTYNIFDPKTVQDAGALEARANERYGQAYQAAQQGDKERALELVREALQISPNHRAANKLMEQLTAEMQPAASDGATSPTAPGMSPAQGTPAPPAPPAAPGG